METFPSLDKFFTTALSDLSCDDRTRAYVVSIFTKFAKVPYDLPSDSITLTFYEAKRKQEFATYQSLGDWIFFCRVEFPENLQQASQDFYLTVGQLSYYSCYRLLKRQWRLYEEMADRFETLENETRYLLAQSKSG
jgi:hypothetical protein